MTRHNQPYSSVHPFAATYPITASVVEEMAASMVRDGFDPEHPLIVCADTGELIDGRTRDAAAEQACVEPVVRRVEFATDEAKIEFIRRANDIRRGSMTTYQRVVCASLQGVPRRELPTYCGTSSSQVKRCIEIFEAGGILHDELWSGRRLVLPRAPTPARPRKAAAVAVNDEANRPRTVLDYATEKDLITITTSSDQGDIAAALERTRAAAASRGWAPEFGWKNPVPSPHLAKGVSTLYGPDGEVKLSWVKSSLDIDRAHDALRAMASALAEGIEPQPLLDAPEHCSDRLANFVLIGDPHVGMFSWGKETLGPDWDLDIARRAHRDAGRLLLAESPRAARTYVIFMGDTTHTDSYEGTTNRGKHRLDVDSRYPKMIDTAARMIEEMAVDAAAASPEVHVAFVPGNHDMHFAANARIFFKRIFAGSRVQVIDTDSPFIYVEFGQTLLGFGHGEGAKPREQLDCMARDMSEAWGRTREHVCYHGHIHSEKSHEYSHGIVRAVPNLAPNDAHAAALGYRSNCCMIRYTYDSEFGELTSGRVTLDRVL